MKHRQIRRELVSRLGGFRQAELPVDLYPHQEEALQNIVTWLEDPKGTRRAHVSHATGLGKTVLFASLLRFCAGMKTLVIVSTKTLVDQTVRKLAEFVDGDLAHMSSLPAVQDSKGEVLARRWKDGLHDVIVTTKDSFKRYSERLKEEFNPHIVIWDECHWAYTEMSQKALDLFRQSIVLAFSATPDFLTSVCKNDFAPVTLDNGQVLYGIPDRFASTHFGTLLDDRGARWGIEHGHLAPLAWGRLEFGFSLDGIPTKEGPAGPDYDQSALAKVLAKNWSFVAETICKLYKSDQYGLGGRFSAAICPGVKQAYEITEALNGIGVPSACITGSTPNHERRRILEAGENGDIRFLASVFALREGWDSPKVEVAMMLRPTKSRVLYIQFMGRVLRVDVNNPGKVALVLDPHYQNTRLAPLSAPVLFGSPGQEVRDGDVLVGPKKRGKRRVIPSWLTREKLSKLKPVLVVEKLDIEYWAGSDGFFVADGERWGTVNALAKRLGLDGTTVAAHLTDWIPKRAGWDSNGCPRSFYLLSAVEKACEKLIQVMPTAGKEGAFTLGGIRYATIEGYAKTYPPSTTSIRSRLLGKDFCWGKDVLGRRQKFYGLPVFEDACKDLLTVKHASGKDGCFKANDVRWGNIPALVRELGLTKRLIRSRIASCRKMFGKNSCGRINKYYAFPDVKEACADLPEDILRAGSDCTIELEGRRWVTVGLAVKILDGPDWESIKCRIGGCTSIKGRASNGQPLDFYPISEIRKACADLLEDIPRAGLDGIIELEGRRWVTVGLAVKILDGLRYGTIVRRIGNCHSRKGRALNGQIRDFYALSDIKKACADLLKKKKKGKSVAVPRKKRVAAKTAVKRSKAKKTRKKK